MGTTLTGAEIVGGAVVTITGDLSGLRAAHMDAKRITLAAGNDLKMVASVNTTQFTAGLQAMKRQAEQMVADFNRILSRAGNLGMGTGAGLDFKGRSGGMSEIAAEQSANRKRWESDSKSFQKFLRDEHRDRLRQAREDGAREAEAYLDGQQRIFNRWKGSAGTSGGGGGSGGGSSGGGSRGRGGRIRGLDDALENFLPGTFNTAFKIAGAAAIARAVGSGINLVADMAELGPRGGLEEAVIGADKVMGGAGSGLNRIQRAMTGSSLGDKAVEWSNSGKSWMRRNTPWLRNKLNFGGSLDETETFEERKAFDKYEAQRELRMERARRSSAASYASNQILSAKRYELIGGAEGQAESALSQFNEQVGSLESPAITQARKALEEDVKRGRGLDAQMSSAMSLRENAASDARNSILSRRNGQGDLAFGQAQYAEKMNLIATQRQQLIDVKDPKKLAFMKRENAIQLKQLEAQQEEQIEDRKLQKKLQTDSKIAAVNEASLRKQHRGYEADLVAFDAAAQAKLNTIRDINEKAIEQSKFIAQRSVIIAQQQDQIEANKITWESSATVAELRSQSRNQEADLTAFDSATALGLKGFQNDADRSNFMASRRRERDAMIVSQQRDNAAFGRGINTRIRAAGASGSGQSTLAGVMRQLAGMNEELEGAAPDRKRLIIGAQRAELYGLEEELMRPKSYLRGFDPLREAVGDPLGGSGRAGESERILREINESLKAIAAKEGGLGV